MVSDMIGCPSMSIHSTSTIQSSPVFVMVGNAVSDVVDCFSVLPDTKLRSSEFMNTCPTISVCPVVDVTFTLHRNGMVGLVPVSVNVAVDRPLKRIQLDLITR